MKLYIHDAIRIGLSPFIPSLSYYSLSLLKSLLMSRSTDSETLQKNLIPGLTLKRSGSSPSVPPSQSALTANLKSTQGQRPKATTSTSTPHIRDPKLLSKKAITAVSSSSSSSSSSSEGSKKPQIRNFDGPRQKPCNIPPSHVQPPMSATKGAQELDRERREPMVAKRSDPSRVTKESNVRQKLRTYEALLALSEGYMPTTEQMTAWARYALRASGVLDSRNRRLSSQGRVFVRDVRAWIEAVIELGLSKNADDKIQEFIYNTSKAQISARGPDISGATTSTLRSQGPDMQKMYARLRSLGSLLYSSPEFRKLLGDCSVLAREILADAASQVGSLATTASDQIRPSDAEISQIDQPADAALGDRNAAMPSTYKIQKQAKEKGYAYAEQAKQKSQQSRDDIEAYLREKFPKQRRDAVVNRLKRVITEIQENPDFQEMVDFMMDLAKRYGDTFKEKMGMELEKSKKSGIQTDEHFDRALQDAKAILMVFAGGRPLDDISDALQQVMGDIQNDPDLQGFYNHATNFLRRALTDKDFITSDAADAEAHNLYDRSQRLLHIKENRYRPDIERLFDEVKSFGDAIVNDRENRRVVETSKKVFNDLVVLDSKGAFKGWRKKVVRDIIDVILPRFIGEVRYIPIPRVEYQDRDFDLILENVILESEHFLPHRTLFEAFTKAEYINDYTFTSHYAATTRISINNINLFFKDASFVIRKKTGLIPFSDRGFLDVFMDGRGASAEIILDSLGDESDDEDNTQESYFHVRSVKVTIHRFRYSYHAYHSWAASIFSPVIRPMVRRLLASLLEQKIRETLEHADREMHAMAERMRVASIANQGGGSVEAWIRAVLSRPEHARRRGTPYRVNVGLDELLFPGEHGPGAVIGKMKAGRERVEAGGEQEGWRNDIFDVRA